MVQCWFCGKSFGTKKALNAHLQFCSERKKQRDRWIRYDLPRGKFVGVLCVISRSPKTLVYVGEMHQRFLKQEITPEAFWGYIMALSDQKLIELKIEQIAARAHSSGGTGALEPQPEEARS